MAYVLIQEKIRKTRVMIYWSDAGQAPLKVQKETIKSFIKKNYHKNKKIRTSLPTFSA